MRKRKNWKDVKWKNAVNKLNREATDKIKNEMKKRREERTGRA